MKKVIASLVVLAALSIIIADCGGGGGGSAPSGSSAYQMGGSIQGQPLTLASAATVSVYAGTDGGPGYADGTGTAVRFDTPYGLAMGGADLYVADSENQVIRKVVTASGLVSTHTGSAGVYGYVNGTGTSAKFSYPRGVASDGTYLYVADTANHAIRKITIATGAVSTLAGSATGSSGWTDATGTSARFNIPTGIVFDNSQVYLYVADSGNHTIRRVGATSGIVTTMTGSHGVPGSANGTGTDATFKNPEGVAYDGTSLYVTDTGNNTIRKVDLSFTPAVVSTLAGTVASGAFANGTGSAARFNQPKGIAADGLGNLYVADSVNHSIRSIVISSAAVTTPFGSNFNWGFADGTGTSAHFLYPQGIIAFGTTLYVSEEGNHKIRKLNTSTGAVTTLAGKASEFGSLDGTGRAARFFFPRAITTDGTNLYVADTNNYTIRKIAISSGLVSLLTGSAGVSYYLDGTGTAAFFSAPVGITTDGTNLFATDYKTIRKIVIATGLVSTLTGSAVQPPGTSDGTGDAARFSMLPEGITTDGTNLYVADTDNCTIRKIETASALVSTLSGSAGACSYAEGFGNAARFNKPKGITTDGTNLYVADTSNYRIRKIVLATGEVTTLAGNGTWGAGDGTGSGAFFTGPYGITTDGNNLYVTEGLGGVIRKIVIATAEVTTPAGNPSRQGDTDGAGSNALFSLPGGITTDGKSLYVIDEMNNNIRKID